MYAGVMLLTSVWLHCLASGARIARTDGRGLPGDEDQAANGITMLEHPTRVTLLHPVRDSELEPVVGLPGCLRAQKVLLGSVVKTGVTMSITMWECMRCEEGYREKWTETEVEGTSTAAQGPERRFRQTCEWKPCGELCQLCSEGVRKPSMFKTYEHPRESKCLACQHLPVYRAARLYKTALSARQLIDGEVTKNPLTVSLGDVSQRPQQHDWQVTKVKITQVCAPIPTSEASKLPSTEPSAPVAEAFLRTAMVAEPTPLLLLKLLHEYTRRASAEFIEASKVNEKALDMVQDGTKFMDSIITVAVGQLDADDVSALEGALLQSRLIADVDGALDLCISKTFDAHGDDRGKNDHIHERTLKACTGVSNTLQRFQRIVCTKLDNCEKVRESSYYETVSDAPRRALDVLTMFGALD